MKIKSHQSINSRTDFFYYAFRNILLVGLPLVIVYGLALSHLSLHSFAANSGTDSLNISIYTACTLSSTVNSEHDAVVDVGTYKPNIGKTTITTLCNDGNGYAVYANGFSNNEEGNNKLINSTYPQYGIDTGLATSGLTSQWAMKLNNIENDPSPTPPTIESSYNNTYGLVPNIWTKVAHRQSGTTDMSKGSSFTTTYSVYASSSQYNGVYEGQVKYALIHPYRNDSIITRTTFEGSFALNGKSKISIDGSNYYAMQDMSSDICASVIEGGESSSIQLVDLRDGKIYWVAKLKDGHCWMTQNLDLDLVGYTDAQNNTTMRTLTSEDTDLTDYSLAGAYLVGYNYNANTGIISWTPASSAKTVNFTGGNNTTISGWVSSNNIPASASRTDDAGTEHASLGNYYNWTSAIASNDSSSLARNTFSDIANNPKNSICPKGWRLPTISNQGTSTIGSTNEFARLNYLYNGNSSNTNTGLVDVPLYFITSGEISTKVGGIGSAGNYLSSSFNGNNAGFFKMSATQIISDGQYSRSYGWSIRCVAK